MTTVRNRIGLVGRKIGMTQIFSDRGELVPVTVLQVGPCRVVQKKIKGRDGYEALQLGFEENTRKRGENKPRSGHFKKAGVSPMRVLSEIRDMSPDEYEIGQELKADLFKIGDVVDVSGMSKGRGFTGVVKRYGFKGGPATHGSMFHRAPGSIGAAAYPSRVFKGMRMPGHMGNEKVTVSRLLVMGVDPEKSVILVKGAVPGAKTGMVLVTADRA